MKFNKNLSHALKEISITPLSEQINTSNPWLEQRRFSKLGKSQSGGGGDLAGRMLAAKYAVTNFVRVI